MNTVKRIMICGGAAVLAGVFSVYSHILLLPVIALAAYMGSEWGLPFSRPVIGGITAGMLIAFTPDLALCITLAMYVILIIALTVYAKKRLPHRYGLLAAAAIILLGTYLALALEPMLAGQPPYLKAVELWEQSYLKVASSAFSVESVKLLEGFTALIPDFLMFCCLLSAEVQGLALILLIMLWHKVFRTRPRRMVKFRYWRLPKTALAFIIIAAAAAGLCYLLRLEQANSVALTLGLIVISMFAVQGLAFLMFVLELSEAPRGLSWLLWGGVVLFLPYSLIFLSLVGIREQLKNRRGYIMRAIKEKLLRARAQSQADEYAKYGYIREEKEPKEENAAPEEEGGKDEGSEKE